MINKLQYITAGVLLGLIVGLLDWLYYPVIHSFMLVYFNPQLVMLILVVLAAVLISNQKTA